MLALFADLNARGLDSLKVLVADGAADVWAAAGEVWPHTREILCAIPYTGSRAKALQDRERFAKATAAFHPRTIRERSRSSSATRARRSVPSSPAWLAPNLRSPLSVRNPLAATLPSSPAISQQDTLL